MSKLPLSLLALVSVSLLSLYALCSLPVDKAVTPPGLEIGLGDGAGQDQGRQLDYIKVRLGQIWRPILSALVRAYIYSYNLFSLFIHCVSVHIITIWRILLKIVDVSC